jgi:nitrite reductase/ring-hydroxylating ferredoxin subunit
MSVPEGFRRVASCSELQEKKGRMVLVGDEEVALWKVDGTVYAVDNLCPHQHAPALHIGHLSGLSLSCPMHGWTFSLLDGREEQGFGRVRVRRVVVQGDDVYVEEHRPSWG